ncbi:YARHG domain-containing protein [Blastochloris tepida]|uniref:YARHG domain-containing protein n=1 Tax=Blastochloris tepida TaxID=2233851 RepID=A0A348G0E9_9HYPH|nr:YARHG domain-containing protein [Blastochloris tepida]BBF93032.1 hypothetical protein BLTE_17170 [Blastochloris tepida]
MRTIIMRTIFAALAAGFVLGASTAPSFAQDVCQDLWVERNSIYKANGYCFKTSRAISYFGNAGCLYDNEASIPMSRADRARVQQIRALERQYGCR